jgi:hypothetical protein
LPLAFAQLIAVSASPIATFPSLETLDAQLDEAKLAFGVVRPLSDFAESDWAKWWGAVVEVVPVGNLIWLAVDQESGDAVVQ